MICPIAPMLTFIGTPSVAAPVVCRFAVSQDNSGGMLANAKETATHRTPYRALNAVGASTPSTINAIPAMNRQKDVAMDRFSYLSLSQEIVTVTTKATAYGGTVNSCASRPVYPRPETIVGVNNEILENGTEIHM